MSNASYLDTLDLSDEERARVQDLGDEVQVTLLEPITYKHSKFDGGDRTLTELRLVKKVKGKHMKAMDQTKGDIGQSLALVAALSGTPANAMDELDSRDMEVVLTLVEPFLPKRRRTGTP
ncbi:phage tail assembly protein [Pseudomonas segetis]|uniref:Phage tail assembly chaperone protein, E, or 41 or 14 n=1 Tax=Pseudomonas segetis TaxID=298908 RepID=A0A239JSH3_9PSED|nr:phage tail assembly protein [Pseudomonas segetis]SNT07764.1 Phage tail assembly chaperone protein, E, or 41 or 14 [Pseudomonas segetis]